MSRPADRPVDPMTIANAVELGLSGVILYCRKCNREGAISFDVLALPQNTPMPEIAKARRFVCSGCGGRSVVSLPGWAAYKPPDAGRMGSAATASAAGRENLESN